MPEIPQTSPPILLGVCRPRPDVTVPVEETKPETPVAETKAPTFTRKPNQ